MKNGNKEKIFQFQWQIGVMFTVTKFNDLRWFIISLPLVDIVFEYQKKKK